MDYLLREFDAEYDKTSKVAALEDSIMRKGKPATAGSQILEGFVSPFDAAVVEKLDKAGIPIIGTTAMDEFGIIATDSELLVGAVKAVSSGSAAYVLCNDIFGKYRQQAPLNGLCYIHPTHGTVSRYGLIHAVSSMDQIGIMCNDPADGFQLLSVIAGNDKRDGAMFPEESYSYSPFNGPDGKIRIAIPDNVWNGNEYGEKIIPCLENKFETKHIELKYFEVYKQVLYILSCAELCNNISRYDGIKFGYRSPQYTDINDLYLNTRSEGFGRGTKLAAIMGAVVLSQDNYEPYYEKAMKIRRLIKDAVDFGDYDVIALPAQCNGTPYEQSSLYALTVLAGLPTLSVPLGNTGIQLVAGIKNENVLFGAWEVLKLEI